MSRIDPLNFTPSSFGDCKVCTECFADTDLKEKIASYGQSGECSYCDEDREHVASFHEVAEFIGERVSTFFGLAVDQLPYVSREGGFQGRHEDTYDVLFDNICLEVTAAQDEILRNDLVNEIGDETWCDYDWLALELDQSLLSSWSQFCQSTKGQRRFFFHRIGEPESHHPDERSNYQFLYELAKIIERLGLIKEVSSGFRLYRARKNKSGPWQTVSELGPPPAERCLQSNRMNPPGIPMFYGAESQELAVSEIRAKEATVGCFEVLRPFRFIDLADLPKVPGFFSEASRADRQHLRFLHTLSQKMSEPVDQNDRVNVDYIPTQIVTEFLRDFDFSCGSVDGLRYVTSLESGDANFVLFANQSNIADGRNKVTSPSQWLALVSTEQIIEEL